ncbi:MAG: hypothetical protein R3C68_11750 [Myxococcota bacterium]
MGAILGPFGTSFVDAWPRVAFRLRIAPWDRRFLGFLLVAAPLMFGQTLLTVDEWYEKWFGGLQGAGGIATLSYAL